MPEPVAGTEVEIGSDLFSAAFDEAVGGLDENTSPSDEMPKEAVVEAPVEEATEKVEEKAEEKAEEEKPEPVPAPAPQVDVKALVSEIVEATKPQVAPAEKPAPEAPVLSKDEIEAEEQFKKDWPEHAAREERLKRELEALKNSFAETLESIQGQINPLAQTVQMTAQERHLQTITTAHPDALDIVPKVEEWIGTQPKIYQGEMKRIIEGGSAAEVVELLNLYKGATAPPEQLAKAKPDPAKEARLKRMESPTTVRTAVTAEADPDDFDSAFEAEAKKYKMQ